MCQQVNGWTNYRIFIHWTIKMWWWTNTERNTGYSHNIKWKKPAKRRVCILRFHLYKTMESSNPLSDENQIKVFLRAVLVIKSDESEWGDLGGDMTDVFMTMILMVWGVCIYTSSFTNFYVMVDSFAVCQICLCIFYSREMKPSLLQTERVTRAVFIIAKMLK